MSGFIDVYQRLCERYPSPQDRGRAFEPLVANVLRTAPLYRERFAEVTHWSEWQGRDGGDIGIDIVARRHDDGLVAIQCKCQDRIDKGDIDSFLADSQRRPDGEPYVERYIFTTATKSGAPTRSAPSPVSTRQCSGLTCSVSTARKSIGTHSSKTSQRHSLRSRARYCATTR